MVKFEVKNSVKDYKSFLRYNAFIVNKKIAPSIFFDVAGLVFLFFVCLWGITYETFLLLGCICIFLSGVYAGFIEIGIQRALTKTLKQAVNFEKNVNTYTFDDNETFVITFHQKGKDKDNRIAFNDIKRVYERKDFFYLFVNKKNAFILKKNNLTEQEVIELRGIFINAFDKKQFRTKYRNKKD